MAAKKKNQTTAEQKEITSQGEQTGQEQEETTGQGEQTGQEQEETTGQGEQTGQNQEQAAGQSEQDGGKEDKPAKGPKRDEFANIPNPCVYCGPSVRGVARQYTTYMGGIPAELKEFIRKHPEARRLIVSTEKFTSVRKRLETPGTAEAIIFKKVKAEL